MSIWRVPSPGDRRQRWRTAPRRSTAIVAALTLALVGCGGHGSPPAATHGQLFGFNDTPDAQSLALQASLGMTIRRYPVPWNRVESLPGRWSWTYFDRAYAATLAHGLRPLLEAVGSPCWSQGLSVCNAVGPPAARFLPRWAEYLRRLVTRYPRAIGIEIWNEPNATPWFWPHPDPREYTTLLKAAYAAIKGVDPQMQVVSGGLLPAEQSGPRVVADWQFLAAMYRDGAKGSFDAIGAHPYPVAIGPGRSLQYSVAAMQRDLAKLEAVRAAAGDQTSPIWITETGVSTGPEAGFPPAATSAQQASLLAAVLDAVRGERDIPVVIIHRLMDTTIDSSPVPVQSGFGVFRANGTPKPAACALSHEFHGSLSC